MAENKEGQVDRLAVRLDDTKLFVDDGKVVLTRKSLEGLKEVMLVKGDENVSFVVNSSGCFDVA